MWRTTPAFHWKATRILFHLFTHFSLKYRVGIPFVIRQQFQPVSVCEFQVYYTGHSAQLSSCCIVFMEPSTRIWAFASCWTTNSHAPCRCTHVVLMEYAMIWPGSSAWGRIVANIAGPLCRRWCSTRPWARWLQ